jgi:hypothetical protein
MEAVRAANAEFVRLSWLEIIQALIREAKRGNVRAFKLLRDEAWGTSPPEKQRPIETVHLEDLLSAIDEEFPWLGSKKEEL